MKLKNIPRQVLILSFVSLFTDIASEMLYPVTPIFLTAVLGSSMATVGIIEGAAEVTAGIFKGYFGRISDKLKKRSIFVVLGYSLSALSKPLPGIFPAVSSVIISRISDRIGKGMRTAPRDALLATYAEGRTGSIFGFHRAMDTLGAALGPIGALILLHFYPGDYTLIFLVAFAPSILAVSFTLFVKDNPASFKKATKRNYAEFWRTAPRQYKIILLLVTIFSLVNSSDVFLILKSKNISNSVSLAIWGYIFYNLVYAAASYPLGKYADKAGKKKVYVGGLYIFAAVYLGFGSFPGIYFIWILFALYGIYAASTEGVVKAWVSDLIADEQRGSAIGLLTMLTSLAVMLGSFTAGILWDRFGSAVPFLLSSIVSAIVATLFLMLKKNGVDDGIK
ncbi:MAG TPA: MFS transporter [Ignavibacteriaceae bacterium]|nr:MFS transporter [Ignavibacteriaceae bacterium]